MSEMPLLTFGTFTLRGEEAKKTVLVALECGYRSIDTARCYKNEREVGVAIALSGLARQQIFVTSKLAPEDLWDPYAGILASLAALELSYIDLMLVHWPGKSKTAVTSQCNREARLLAWTALKRAKAEGLVRAIGVSNYAIKHLEEIDGDVAVNQVERHPLYPQDELCEYCRRKGIVLQGYSPLGCGRLLEQPALVALAGESGVSVADMLLLWQVQRGIPIVVKATSPARIRSNFVAVTSGKTLTPETLSRLDSFSSLPPTKFCWDPSAVS